MPQAVNTVDEYIQSLPPDYMQVMSKVRKAIKAAAPMAEEVISYQVPTYKYLGPLVHIAAFKNHCSFFGVSKSILQIFKDELAKYHTAGTTIHFGPGNPLPDSLVKKIVKTRIRENEERKGVSQIKKANKKSKSTK